MLQATSRKPQAASFLRLVKPYGVEGFGNQLSLNKANDQDFISIFHIFVINSQVS